ncbi:hypothetical protein PTKIN_Ptkin06aG0195900 [Pterospermum kingtungense]
MDFFRNVSVTIDQFQQEQVLSSPACSKLGVTLAAATASFEDLFPAQNTEVDVSLEWLSIFVEDCLSSTGNCIPVAEEAATTTNVQNKISSTTKPMKPLKQPKPHQTTSPSLQKLLVPSKKARSKRKRAATTFSNSADPPMLQQAYWLADSELINVPKKEDDDGENSSRNLMGNGEVEESKTEEMVVSSRESLRSLPRRCSHCLAQRTPQWRAGPMGPKTLCNACGVRYKSGRLLPEYRPAKSPTFVSYLHSNSHVKVMEMRMAMLSPIPSEQ